jgi:hypothetical protein
MWVYKQDSLRKRLRLTPAIGDWLDYWLFLHAEETHPVWRNRPLGVRQLADAALRSRAKHDHTLRGQLSQEVRRAARVSPMIEVVPPSPGGDPLSGSDWDPNWLRWFETVVAIPPESLVNSFSRSLHDAITTGDYSTAQFLTRRLASEVTEDDWSHTGRFITTKSAICDSGRFADRLMDMNEFVEALSSTVTSMERGDFKVTVSFARTTVPRSVVRTFSDKGPSLVIETGDDQALLLTGVIVEVKAMRVDEAAALGLEAARRLLDDLRLIFYIRTHMSGNVVVEAAEPPKLTYFSLPQPFWSKGPGSREVPRIPKRFRALISRLPEEEASRWNAARWHISQSFADWAEDGHTAATHLWQALESFCPPGDWRKVLTLIPKYLDHVVLEMGKHLATRVSLQARELKTVGESSDWYYWVATRVPFSQWLQRVLDPRSTNSYKRWSSPSAPRILFDGSLGLLQIVNRRLRDSAAEQWMQQRLEADLVLLYGLRNKVVHGGQRVFTPRIAEYLGQTTAEILFGVMKARAASLDAE